jgi:tetratricopeptide (TPR) repeat protein
MTDETLACRRKPLLMTNALYQLASTNPQQAVSILATECAESPCAETYTLYAHCLLKLNQIEQAQAAYLAALECDADFIAAHFGLAQALQHAGDFAQALTHLYACLTETPADTTFLFQVGTCQLQLNQWTEAQATLEKVLAIYPTHLEALVNLGSCFMHQKNYAKAIHYFSTACRIDQEHLPALYNLACALMEYKRFPQARDHFLRYLEKNNDDLEARYHLGFVHLMLDEYACANTCFYQILQVNPDNISVMHNLASIALKQKEPSVALGYYQRILALAETDDIALYMHAALAQKNPPAQAPSSYVKALFDQYAERFDAHLIQELDYQTPQLLYQFWLKQNRSATEHYRVLDLGCGTGLMGALLKTHTSNLIGVDLSKEMLQVAEKKSLYDALHEAEIMNFLNNCTTSYDLIVLADVLVYFGDCDALFKACKKVAQNILFSIESTKEKNYILSVHGRYQHNLDYLCALCVQHGFQYKIKPNVTLRKQNNQAVLGDLVLLMS